ncbi:shufflon system plasmid conjugative transfer pilus tip adhesin PilV [Salmonella enterica subsp. enterica serovar Bareilly]|nr:shufflon system plasmid conjugative transfer pilus tip adhesin PilV [Salmonella enterica subsp. enterica serovar Bareilly]EGG3986130.1 shufflon system plasmid conjugative transfer pilus tip adhesin PilV [Salmonella enterica]
MTFSRNQPARGINSLDASLAFVAIFAVMAVFLAMINDWQTERENQVIAQQTSRVADAAKKYIGDNYNSLSSAAPTTLTTATLVNAGYLNSTLAERNSASQTYAIGIRRMNNSGLLDALLVTLDGRVLTYKEMRSISASISGLGGYIEDGNTATGALGGWEVSLADYSLTSSAGHLAVALTADTLNGVNEESDRLYRFSVNGHPDYNRMHTDIDMNRSNLRDASDVSTTTLTADQQVSLATSGFFGWRRDSSGALATGFYYENDGSDWIRTVNNASLSTGGTLKGGTIQSEGMVIAGTYTMPGKTVTAGDACTASALGISGQISDTTGLIAHDSTGGTLSCQSGVWRKNNLNGIKAPPPQEIGCRLTGSNSRAYARADSEGQLWTRWDNTNWIRGSSEMTSTRFVRVYAGGMYASTSSGSTGSSQADYTCSAVWVW